MFSPLTFRLRFIERKKLIECKRQRDLIASNISIVINFQRIRSRVYSWCTVSIGGIEQRIICDARHARIAGVHDQRSHFRCGNLTPDISGVKIPSRAFKQKRYYSNSCVCLLSIVLSIERILFHTSFVRLIILSGQCICNINGLNDFLNYIM